MVCMGGGWSFINEVSRINKGEYGSTQKKLMVHTWVEFQGEIKGGSP
jgi:hypothetical protein